MVGIWRGSHVLNPTIAYRRLVGSLPNGPRPSGAGAFGQSQFLSTGGAQHVAEDPRFDEPRIRLIGVASLRLLLLADFRYDNARRVLTDVILACELLVSRSMPESLSGHTIASRYGVPHQMFSELVAIPGLVDGLLGMDRTPPRSPSDPGLPPRAGRLRFPIPCGQGQLSMQPIRPWAATAELIPRRPEFGPGVLSRPASGATVVSVMQGGNIDSFSDRDNGSDVMPM